MNALIPKGSKAPDFSLLIGEGQLGDQAKIFQLSKQTGKNIILAFYPADWSSVCGSQLTLYNELLEEFAKYNAVLYGISVDGTFCHKAFKENRGYKMDLLCDFEPKGKVSKVYGAYNEQFGFCERALYVIDTNGVVQYSYLSPIGINPGAKEILETLKLM